MKVIDSLAMEMHGDAVVALGYRPFGYAGLVCVIFLLAAWWGGCVPALVDQARIVAVEPHGWGEVDLRAPSAMVLFDSMITDQEWLQSFDSALAFAKRGRELEPLVDAYGVECRFVTVRYVVRTYSSGQRDTIERGRYCTGALRVNGRLLSNGGPVARLIEQSLDSWEFEVRFGGFADFDAPLSATDLDSMPVGTREWTLGRITANVSGPCYWAKQFDSSARRLGRWSSFEREAGDKLVVNDTNLLVRIAMVLSREGLRDWIWSDLRLPPRYVGQDANFGFASSELQGCLRWTPLR